MALLLTQLTSGRGYIGPTRAVLLSLKNTNGFFGTLAGRHSAQELYWRLPAYGHLSLLVSNPPTPPGGQDIRLAELYD